MTLREAREHSACPVNKYLPSEGTICQNCPAGTSTSGLTGLSQCLRTECPSPFHMCTHVLVCRVLTT